VAAGSAPVLMCQSLAIQSERSEGGVQTRIRKAHRSEDDKIRPTLGLNSGP